MHGIKVGEFLDVDEVIGEVIDVLHLMPERIRSLNKWMLLIVMKFSLQLLL